MNERKLIEFIPYDKGEANRYGFLNMINHKDHTLNQIDEIRSTGRDVNQDINSLYISTVNYWQPWDRIYVGESGTIYRFIQFRFWQKNEERKFVKQGSLIGRELYDDPNIVNKKLSELKKLDTTQWVSAAILNGVKGKLYNPDEKIKLTYDCKRKWEKDEKVEFTEDKTILRQARAFYKMMETDEKDDSFTPSHSEDYCFARAFDYITKERGEIMWKQLRNHESDRIESMEKELKNLHEGKTIESKDHRVIQAVAMLAKFKGIKADFKYMESVKKSWPEFWDFLFEF